MNENLARRVGRLVSGSLNALVSAVENAAPEAVMEQAIREIDAVIDEVRAELGQQLAQKHVTSKRLMEENARHENLAGQLELAVAEGRDDLAEAGIAEQMDIEARLPVLEATIADCLAREKELEAYVQALQAKRRDMRAELQAFQKQQAERQAPAQPGMPAGTAPAERRADQAGAAFERVLGAASGLPPREASGNGRQLAELEELARRNRVAERLAAMKAAGQDGKA
ncbi:MAG: PspA/IM30 family protein [Gammaproteobacteria bacterium]|nr:PspA/IM30 family protein [Gammaproteobacteria bacterium]